MHNTEFENIFTSLKALIDQYEPQLIVVDNTKEQYTLNTHHIMKNGSPLFFGMVKIGKNYVSLHLMPVYVFPDLLSDIPETLKKRMQGKSCFNFKKSDQVPIVIP